MALSQKSEVYEPFLVLRHSGSQQQAKDEDRSQGLVRRISSMKPGGVQASFCSLFSSTIGIGFLAIPYATSECGLVLGAIVLILGGICFGLYYKALAQASDRTGRYSYIGMVDNLYGPKWGFFAELVIILSCFGMLSVMWVISLEIVTSLFPIIDSIYEKAAVLIAVGILVEMPLSIKPEIASLRYVSIFSFLCVAFLAAVVCVELMNDSVDFSEVVLFKFDMKTVDAIILVLFAYDATMFIPIIYSEMAYSRQRSYDLMKQVIRRTSTILVVFYLILGIGGYLTHIPVVPEIFVFREKMDSDESIVVAKYLVLLALLIEVPLIVNPARLTVQQMFGRPDFVYNPGIYYGGTFAFVILPILMALGFRRELSYFKVLGGVCSVWHGFILPSTESIEPWCT